MADIKDDSAQPRPRRQWRIPALSALVAVAVTTAFFVGTTRSAKPSSAEFTARSTASPTEPTSTGPAPSATTAPVATPAQPLSSVAPAVTPPTAVATPKATVAPRAAARASATEIAQAEAHLQQAKADEAVATTDVGKAEAYVASATGAWSPRKLEEANIDVLLERSGLESARSRVAYYSALLDYYAGRTSQGGNRAVDVADARADLASGVWRQAQATLDLKKAQGTLDAYRQHGASPAKMAEAEGAVDEAAARLQVANADIADAQARLRQLGA